MTMLSLLVTFTAFSFFALINLSNWIAYSQYQNLESQDTIGSQFGFKTKLVLIFIRAFTSISLNHLNQNQKTILNKIKNNIWLKLLRWSMRFHIYLGFPHITISLLKTVKKSYFTIVVVMFKLKCLRLIQLTSKIVCVWIMVLDE